MSTLIGINPREHEAQHGHIGLAVGAAEGIQAICDGLMQGFPGAESKGREG